MENDMNHERREETDLHRVVREDADPGGVALTQAYVGSYQQILIFGALGFFKLAGSAALKPLYTKLYDVRNEGAFTANAQELLTALGFTQTFFDQFDFTKFDGPMIANFRALNNCDFNGTYQPDPCDYFVSQFVANSVAQETLL